MRHWAVGVIAGVALASGLSGGVARAELPVSYMFGAGIVNEVRNPGGSLPGSNDWHCVPSAAHPDPVVLVHGFASNAQTDWGTYVPLLANEGYCVFAVTYGGYPQQPWPVPAFAGLRDIASSSAEIAAFVDRVLAATGAHQVDIVAHSEGTVAANYYVKRRGGAAVVHRIVSLGANHTGSAAFGAVTARDYARRNGFGPDFEGSMDAVCESCLQVLAGSPLLTELNSDGLYAPGVVYTNILTRYDEFVVPYTAGAGDAPNATTIVVQDGCDIDYSDHLSIAASRRAAMYVLNVLDPEHPHPVPCEFVAPLVG